MAITEISIEEAQAAIRAGLTEAARIGEPSSLAVVDSGGNLVAFARSDMGAHGTIEIAIGKAFTASAFRMPSGDLLADVQPGGEIYGMLSIRARGAYVAFGGGLPVMTDGRCVGAVGVSGGPVRADEVIAAAMVAAINT